MCLFFLRETNSPPPSEDPAKSPPMVKNMPNMNVFLSRWLDTCLFQSTCHVWPLDRFLSHEHVRRFVRALMAGPLLCADVVFAGMRHLSLQDPPAAQCLLVWSRAVHLQVKWLRAKDRRDPPAIPGEVGGCVEGCQGTTSREASKVVLV